MAWSSASWTPAAKPCQALGGLDERPAWRAVGGDPLSQPPFARLYAEVPSATLADGETFDPRFLLPRRRSHARSYNRWLGASLQSVYYKEAQDVSMIVSKALTNHKIVQPHNRNDSDAQERNIDAKREDISMDNNGCAIMEMYCLERARLEPHKRGGWLGQAERWHELGRAQRSWRQQKRPAQQTMHSGEMETQQQR